MDLIFTDSNKIEQGIIKSYSLDMAIGADENNFELQTSEYALENGSVIFYENTEFGGIVSGLKVSEKGKITYKGRTWQGILSSKIIRPDTGEDYLTVSGDANAILSTLISRLSLGNLFSANSQTIGNINSFQFDRYTDAYTGIKKMLKSAGLKLKISYSYGIAELSAIPVADYSNDELDSVLFSFTAEKNYKPVNHIICLGRGELAQREVIDLFLDVNGVISGNQSYFGIDEVTEIYDYSSAESADELVKGGSERLSEASLKANTADFNFLATSAAYDIGDIVAARESVTGLFVRQEITKKILTVKDGKTKINYEVGK